MTQRFGLPKWVFTDDPDNQFGESRIQVDVGQTGFFTGREARTFLKFSIASGATLVIKVVSTTNTILQMFDAVLTYADLEIQLVSGGTEGGTFNTPLPIFKTNNMSSRFAFTPTVTMNSGGTHTGGTIVDVLLLNAGVDQGNRQASNSGASESYPLGFPAGTYYIKLINTNGATATGLFKARWEERPEGV